MDDPFRTRPGSTIRPQPALAFHAPLCLGGGLSCIPDHALRAFLATLLECSSFLCNQGTYLPLSWLINMENGVQNGAHSNHDRDVKVNGGAVAVDSPAALDKGKGAAAGTSDAAAQNGHGDKTVPPASAQDAQRGTSTVSLPNRSRMNDLPDEIQHITQGFIPLSTIILRLAQATHDDLEKAIMDAARIKYSPPAINGSATGGGDPPDDSSEANKTRKLTLLKFAQDAHTKWVKALVITDWSRKASTPCKSSPRARHLGYQSLDTFRHHH
ncbi:Mediator of RNA polymerase II transcription subunit 14 like protein [Verticillium longisporum]|nr:Mediator of RNA polymerase II transcription subunit 14 like protein [Verticillium longisporum]